MKTLLNIICSQKVKYSIILLILFTLYIFISAFFYVSAVSGNLESSVFRLHVIANSDSEEDQSLKYIVRDSLLSHMNSLTSHVNSKDEAIEIAKEHLEEFETIAKNTIIENGFDYDVSVEIGNFYFPTKKYGDISFPSGYYDSLRVKIGDAQGQNWWCVMFPPLCFVNMSSGVVPEDSKQLLEEELSDEEFHLISNSDSYDVKLKFKLIEILYNTNLLTAKK